MSIKGGGDGQKAEASVRGRRQEELREDEGPERPTRQYWTGRVSSARQWRERLRTESQWSREC